jgi:hypothetical protein
VARCAGLPERVWADDYLWGKHYLLKVVAIEGPPCLEIDRRKMLLELRPGTGIAKRQEVIEAWYSAKIRQSAPPFIARWEPLMG